MAGVLEDERRRAEETGAKSLGKAGGGRPLSASRSNSRRRRGGARTRGGRGGRGRPEDRDRDRPKGPTPPNMVPPKEAPPGPPPKPVSVQTVQTVLASLAKHIQSGGKAGPKKGVVVPPPNKGHLVSPKLAGLGQIRAALVSAVFTRLDIDCDEILSPREMRRFAELTGFDGDEEEWNQAFRALMKENGMPDATGVGLELFARLVEDQSSDTGCHCTDEELRAMLVKLPQPSDAAPGGVARVDLISAVFKQLDADNDGKLSAKEMRRFAEQTGFQGDDDTWGAEYRSLCGGIDSGDLKRVDLAFFSRLVNDRSADTGCYCSDDELHAMLARLGGQLLIPAGPVGALPKSVPGAVPFPMSTYRSSLVRSVFDRLDIDRDGRLNQAEMRAFAGHTGFQCSEQVWAGEYRQLCADNGRQAEDGVDYVFFCKLVNDQSQDTGCYCTDSELQMMLAKLGGPTVGVPKAHGGMGAPVIERAAEPLPSSPEDRFALVRSVFQAFDLDQDGRLSKSEMQAFAESTGFEGGQSAWDEAFEVLCKEKKRDPQFGVDLNFFTSLVNDKDDSTGCYCTDSELNAALAKASKPMPLPSQKAKATSAPPPAAASASTGAKGTDPASPRGQLIAAVFSLLDSDKDERLNQKEMRAFAVMTGFEGSDSEWADAYRGLCADAGGGDLVDRRGFTTLVDDPSEDTGCHCTDADLRGMLDKLKAPAPATAPSTAAPASLLPSLEGVFSEKDPEKMSRDQLVRAVFAILDADKDGVLNQKEMRAFAEATGMKGGSSKACDNAELTRDVVFFLKFVNDQSDDAGCFCTEEELRTILTKLSAQSAAVAKAVSKAVSAARPPPALSRTDLISAIFQRLDVDRDGKLNPAEMRRFAEQQDFDGTDEEWAEAYKELCTEKGRDPAQGVSLDLFTQLLNDESEDTGCHCTDAEMQAMLTKLPGS